MRARVALCCMTIFEQKILSFFRYLDDAANVDTSNIIYNS